MRFRKEIAQVPQITLEMLGSESECEDDSGPGLESESNLNLNLNMNRIDVTFSN